MISFRKVNRRVLILQVKKQKPLQLSIELPLYEFAAFIKLKNQQSHDQAPFTKRKTLI